jgi:hypothetical protein
MAVFQVPEFLCGKLKHFNTKCQPDFLLREYAEDREKKEGLKTLLCYGMISQSGFKNYLLTFFLSSAAGTGTTPTPTPVGTTPTPVGTTPTTPVTTTPTNTTPSTATPSTTTTPYTATPTGVLGGIGTGVGPSGAGINTDITDAGFRLENTGLFSFFITVVVSSLMFWCG